MKFTACITALVIGVAPSVGTAAAAPDRTAAAPARSPEKGCQWEKFSNDEVGLRAWVQRCDFGSHKIEFVAAGHSLAVKYSDGAEAPDPVIDVLDLRSGETPEDGLRRLFAAHSDKEVVARCVLAPFRDPELKTPADVRRYTFVPNAAYAKKLAAEAVSDDIPEPACGDWGEVADGVQYFETQPASGVAKVLFVRYGQDIPLFDEATLQLR